MMPLSTSSLPCLQPNGFLMVFSQPQVIVKPSDRPSDSIMALQGQGQTARLPDCLWPDRAAYTPSATPGLRPYIRKLHQQYLQYALNRARKWTSGLYFNIPISVPTLIPIHILIHTHTQTIRCMMYIVSCILEVNQCYNQCSASAKCQCQASATNQCHMCLMCP